MDKSPEQKLREYLVFKYKKGVRRMITKITLKERDVAKCEMCDNDILMKKSFVYTSIFKHLLVNKSDLTICEPCAKREHGSKNKIKWKDLVEKLKKK